MSKHLNIGKVIAVAEALKSTHRFRVGCAIMAGRREQSRGRNSYKTHPAAFRRGKTHAEHSALIKAHKHALDGSTLFVARITKAHTLAIAKPCNRCMELILAKGIRDIVYSVADGWEEIRINKTDSFMEK